MPRLLFSRLFFFFFFGDEMNVHHSDEIGFNEVYSSGSHVNPKAPEEAAFE